LSWANAVSCATHDLLSANSIIKMQNFLGLLAQSKLHAALHYMTSLKISAISSRCSNFAKISLWLMTG